MSAKTNTAVRLTVVKQQAPRKPVAATPGEAIIDLDSVPLKAPERRDWNTGSVEVRELRRIRPGRVIFGAVIVVTALVGLITGPIALHMLGIVL